MTIGRDAILIVSSLVVVVMVWSARLEISSSTACVAISDLDTVRASRLRFNSAWLLNTLTLSVPSGAGVII